jgi:hypothetical protein
MGRITGFTEEVITFDFEPVVVTPPLVVTPPPTVSQGDVVINEIMWMGSDVSTADEWIELRNMTSNPIDLTGWTIENLGTSANPTITIPSGTIAPNGYFLISNFMSTDANSALANTVTPDYQTTAINLTNSGEQLTLRDAGAVIIDQTPLGAWAAGINVSATKQSMERSLVPGDGTVVANWYTCIDAGCASTTFWDVAGVNYGTPRADNLSINDPTSPHYIEQDWSATVGAIPDENDIIDDSEIALLIPAVPKSSGGSGTSDEGEFVTVPELIIDTASGGDDEPPVNADDVSFLLESDIQNLTDSTDNDAVASNLDTRNESSEADEVIEPSGESQSDEPAVSNEPTDLQPNEVVNDNSVEQEPEVVVDQASAIVEEAPVNEVM